MKRSYCSIPERDPAEIKRVDEQARAAMREIGAVCRPEIWATSMPVINFSDGTLGKDKEFDMTRFHGRIVLGDAAGFLGNIPSPFPHGENRLTLVRWGDEPDQCGRIECHTWLNATSIVSYREVYIGPGVLLGPGVIIMDCDGHPVDRRLPDVTANRKMAPVCIEEHAWIGLGAMIMKGVTVGHHAVVAAYSVVTKNVPPHCVAAGNPARIVKNFAGESKP